MGALPTPARLSAPASFPDLSVTFRHHPPPPQLLGASRPWFPPRAHHLHPVPPRSRSLAPSLSWASPREAPAQLSSRSALCRPLGSGL